MSKITQISSNSHQVSTSENHESIELDAQLILPSDWKNQMDLERIEVFHRTLEEFSPNAEDTIGDRYRFRAECQTDAELFIRTIEGFIESSWIRQPKTDYPDVGVTFTIKKEISPRDLLWIACSIGDGHVLVQTLEKEDKYTGKRVYFRGLDVNAAEYKPSAAVLKDMKKGAAQHTECLRHLLADAKAFEKNLKAISGEKPFNSSRIKNGAA